MKKNLFILILVFLFSLSFANAQSVALDDASNQSVEIQSLQNVLNQLLNQLNDLLAIQQENSTNNSQASVLDLSQYFLSAQKSNSFTTKVVLGNQVCVADTSDVSDDESYNYIPFVINGDYDSATSHLTGISDDKTIIYSETHTWKNNLDSFQKAEMAGFKNILPGNYKYDISLKDKNGNTLFSGNGNINFSKCN